MLLPAAVLAATTLASAHTLAREGHAREHRDVEEARARGAREARSALAPPPAPRALASSPSRIPTAVDFYTDSQCMNRVSGSSAYLHPFSDFCTATGLGSFLALTSCVAGVSANYATFLSAACDDVYLPINRITTTCSKSFYTNFWWKVTGEPCAAPSQPFNLQYFSDATCNATQGSVATALLGTCLANNFPDISSSPANASLSPSGALLTLSPLLPTCEADTSTSQLALAFSNTPVNGTCAPAAASRSVRVGPAAPMGAPPPPNAADGTCVRGFAGGLVRAGASPARIAACSLAGGAGGSLSFSLALPNNAPGSPAALRDLVSVYTALTAEDCALAAAGSTYYYDTRYSRELSTASEGYSFSRAGCSDGSCCVVLYCTNPGSRGCAVGYNLTLKPGGSGEDGGASGGSGGASPALVASLAVLLGGGAAAGAVWAVRRQRQRAARAAEKERGAGSSDLGGGVVTWQQGLRDGVRHV